MLTRTLPLTLGTSAPLGLIGLVSPNVTVSPSEYVLAEKLLLPLGTFAAQLLELPLVSHELFAVVPSMFVPVQLSKLPAATPNCDAL